MPPQRGLRIWPHVGLEVHELAMSGEMYVLDARPRESLVLSSIAALASHCHGDKLHNDGASLAGMFVRGFG